MPLPDGRRELRSFRILQEGAISRNGSCRAGLRQQATNPVTSGLRDMVGVLGRRTW